MPFSPKSLSVELQKYIDGYWETVQHWYGGGFRRSPNAATQLSLTFPDAGKSLVALRYGQKVRVKVAINGLPARHAFTGRVINRSIMESPGKSYVSFECMDFLELANADHIRLTPAGYNFDGYDPSIAIKEVFDNLPGAPVTTTGVIGTNPKRFVTSVDEIYAPKYISRLELAQKLNALCSDDRTYPSYSLPYFLWQDGEAVINHRKLRALTDEPAKILTRGNAIMDRDIKSRAKHMINRGIVTGANGSDGLPVAYDFTDASKGIAYGRKSGAAEDTTLRGSADCGDYALRQVMAFSTMSEIVKVNSLDCINIFPGDILEVVDLLRPGSARLRAVQVDVTFQPTDVSCNVGLGDVDYLATEYV